MAASEKSPRYPPSGHRPTCLSGNLIRQIRRQKPITFVASAIRSGKSIMTTSDSVRDGLVIRGSTLIRASTSERATSAADTAQGSGVRLHQGDFFDDLLAAFDGVFEVTMFSLLMSFSLFTDSGLTGQTCWPGKNYRPILRRCWSSRSTPFTFSIMLRTSISTSSLPFMVSL